MKSKILLVLLTVLLSSYAFSYSNVPTDTVSYDGLPIYIGKSIRLT
jgi:hypothetical protein